MGGRLSFASLAAWALVWLLAGITGEAPDTTRLLWVHVGLGGLGFAGCLVIGMGFRLDATFHARPLAPLWMQRAAPLAVALSGALLAAAYLPWWTRPLPLLPWAGASLAVGFAVVAAAAGRQSSTPFQADGRYVETDRISDGLIPVVIGYGLLAAGSSLARGLTHPATVHLFLAGFVTTAIYTVAHRILPRFSTMGQRTRLHRWQMALAVPGPALLAWGVANPGRPWAAVGASLEFFAALVYTIMLGIAWKHRRNRQPALPLMFLASLLALNGMLFGLAFLAHAWLRTYVVLHAVNNLVGFVSLTILGAGSAMLGTAVRPVPGSANRNVWRLAWLLAIPLVVWEALLVAGWPGQQVLWLSVIGLGIHAALGLKALGIRT